MVHIFDSSPVKVSHQSSPVQAMGMQVEMVPGKVCVLPLINQYFHSSSHDIDLSIIPTRVPTSQNDWKSQMTYRYMYVFKLTFLVAQSQYTRQLFPMSQHLLYYSNIQHIKMSSCSHTEVEASCGCAARVRICVFCHHPHSSPAGGKGASHWLLWSTSEYAFMIVYTIAA